MSIDENIIILTNAAVAHIQKMMVQRGCGVGFRLSVKKTGCSGYMYKPEIIDEINPSDIKIVASQELSIFIDPLCVDMIKGTTLDFVKKQFGQYQLLFNNPNVVGECGCGESFHLKDILNAEDC